MKDVLTTLHTSTGFYFILSIVCFVIGCFTKQYLPFYSFLIIAVIYAVASLLVKEMRRLHGEG